MSISIVDCRLCGAIPQQLSLAAAELERLPGEAGRLAVVLEIADPDPRPYESQVTWLLRCPECSTHYYKSHHRDDGRHYMDRKCDDTVLRRYDPTMALEFLDGIVERSPGTMPQPLGRLRDAFLVGSGAPVSQVPGRPDLVAAARREREDLRSRREGVLRELEAAIVHRRLAPEVRSYASESLLFHFASEGSWDSVRRVLLAHPDPGLRVQAAGQTLAIGTLGYAEWHTPRRASGFLRAEVPRKERLAELTAVLLEAALAGTCRSEALGGLVTAAYHRGNLRAVMPALVGLLASDRDSIFKTCSVLRTYVDGKKAAQAALLNLLKSAGMSASTDPEILELARLCRGTPKRPKTLRKAVGRKNPPRGGRRR